MWTTVNLFLIPIYLSLFNDLFLKNSNKLTFQHSIDYGVSNTFEELHALRKFHSGLSDVIRPSDRFADDIFLMLWLRKHRFDLIRADKDFRAALDWRKKNDMDSIMNETLLESEPELCWVDGIDKYGSPILSMRIFGIDVRALTIAGQGNKITRRIFQCMEASMIKSLEMSKLTQKVISQSVAIFDMNGFNLKQHGCIRCIQTYVSFLRQSCEFWPDVIRLAVLINVATSGKPLIEVIMRTVDPWKWNATKIFGVDKENWSSFLQEIISTNELSVKFGGNRKSI